MILFTICALSCVDYVFISVAYTIIKVSMFQKLQLEKKEKKQFLRAGTVGCVTSEQRSLSDKGM